MFPVGDDNRDRERWPIVTAVFIALNVAAFLFELSLQGRSAHAVAELIQRWGTVPREITSGRDLPPTIDLPIYATLISGMFLHGGWGHLFGNMLYLWVFGDNVEDRFGRVAFVLFYLGTGVVAAAAQILAGPGSLTPLVGASGAISGVLGAYIAMFPRKRVRVLLFYFITEVPAVVCIGLWAVTQLVYSVGSFAARTAETGETGGVAYLAHAGGFVAGLIVALIWRAISGVPRRGPTFRPRGPW
jgi:membrane associated rhomboid family serine protease